MKKGLFLRPALCTQSNPHLQIDTNFWQFISILSNIFFFKFWKLYLPNGRRYQFKLFLRLSLVLEKENVSDNHLLCWFTQAWFYLAGSWNWLQCMTIIREGPDIKTKLEEIRKCCGKVMWAGSRNRNEDPVWIQWWLSCVDVEISLGLLAVNFLWFLVFKLTYL